MTKLCIFCKHFELDLGQENQSYTPGYGDNSAPGYMSCHKKHFNYIEGCPDYRKIILQAETCKHFKHYDKRCEEQPSEVIQPAIRKLDLDD